MSTYAWTVSIDEKRRIKHVLGGDIMYVVKLALVCGDDNATATVTLKSTAADPGNAYREVFDQVAGSWLYLMEIGIVTQPDAAFDVDVENKRNSHILDTNSNLHTGPSFVVGSDTLGVYPPIMEEITVVVADLGTDKAVNIFLHFLK